MDAHSLRIDLLNTIKEDIRDHYSTYAGRIDTMLLLHTLLFTFALATLQFSDIFVPHTAAQCPYCVEVRHPIFVKVWVWLVAAMLILPFWCLVISVWCKLQLDRWFEKTLGRVYQELHSAIGARNVMSGNVHDDTEHEPSSMDSLSHFVSEYKHQYNMLWDQECGYLLRMATRLLWVSAAVAILLTCLMFWIFLKDRDLDPEGEHDTSSTHFAVIVLTGLLVPTAFGVMFQIRRRCSAEFYADRALEADQARGRRVNWSRAPAPAGGLQAALLADETLSEGVSPSSRAPFTESFGLGAASTTTAEPAPNLPEQTDLEAQRPPLPGAVSEPVPAGAQAHSADAWRAAASPDFDPADQPSHSKPGCLSPQLPSLGGVPSPSSRGCASPSSSPIGRAMTWGVRQARCLGGMPIPED